MIYATSWKITAYDASTGQTKWSVKSYYTATQSENVVDADFVITGDYMHRVQAFDRITGRTAWTTDVAPDCRTRCVVGGVSIAGDTVYVALDYPDVNEQSEKRHFVGMDRLTGRILFARAITGARESGLQCSPLVFERLVALCDFRGRRFVAIDRFSLADGWSTIADPEMPGPVGPMFVRGDSLFSGAFDGAIYVIGVRDGVIFLRKKLGVATRGVVLCGHHLASSNFAVQFVDLRSGRVVARLNTGRALIASALASDGESVFAQSGERLWAVACGAAHSGLPLRDPR